MPNGSAQLRKQRRKFWEEDPHCHWCNTLTVWWDHPHGEPPPNAATTDHLDSRFSHERGKYPGQCRRVLACYTCNQLRCRMETDIMRKLQRIKSGHAHIAEVRGNLPRTAFDIHPLIRTAGSNG